MVCLTLKKIHLNKISLLTCKNLKSYFILNIPVKQKLLFLLIFFQCFSQNSEKFERPSNIKSVIFYVDDIQASLPILEINQKLTLKFDDLRANDEFYYYTVERADAEWRKSRLVKSEYIDGYDDIRIKDFEYSYNTIQNYINYSLELPNSNTKITKSGNYFLKILNSNREPVLIEKFIVIDKKSDFSVKIKRTRNLQLIDTHHSVEFSFNYAKLKIQRPESQLKFYIIQNNIWKTMTNAGYPTFNNYNKLDFQYADDRVFESGNEYHFIDIQDYRIPGGNIYKIFKGETYSAVINYNVLRLNQNYTYNPDINGSYLVNTFNGTDSNTEADYIEVLFLLEGNELINKKEIFIVGDFNQHKKSKSNMLKYNPTTNFFEGKILLKQGIYNYKYVSNEHENSISGSFWPTENNYSVIVYLRRQGAICDEVIAMGYGNSKQIGI